MYISGPSPAYLSEKQKYTWVSVLINLLSNLHEDLKGTVGAESISRAESISFSNLT